MKKIVLSFLFFTIVFSSKPLCAKEDSKESQGKAAKEGKSHATAIAWAGVGVTLLVVTGVIVAIAINRDNDKTSASSHN